MIVVIRTAVHGVEPELLAYTVAFGIMLVFSTIILIGSMFISSAIVGGMEFGEPHIVIPKAIGLLFVVNAVSLMGCVGWVLSIPVWVIGCMIVFRLELWEARVLVGVNIVLNLLARLLVIALVITAATHVPIPAGGVPPGPPLPKEQASDVQAFEALGGGVERDESSKDAPVVAVSLDGSRATDSDLPRLKDFPRLRVLELGGTAVTDGGLTHLEGLTSLEELDLSQTRITDAGLAHLKGLTKLKTLDVTGTRVTDAGVRDLQGALPRVNVVRQAQ